MKKRYIILIILIISIIEVSVAIIKFAPKAMNKAIDRAVEQNKAFTHSYNTCEIKLDNHDYDEAIICFRELLNLYNRSDVRYNLAFALAKKQQYEHAKKELEYIIENEKNNTTIIEQAKKMNKQIDTVLLKMRKEGFR